jgi:hypothetical protein
MNNIKVEKEGRKAEKLCEEKNNVGDKDSRFLRSGRKCIRRSEDYATEGIARRKKLNFCFLSRPHSCVVQKNIAETVASS